MLAIAILAAGKGTRMHSTLPKVLQELSGVSLLERVLESCKDLRPDKIFIIVGHRANIVQKRVSHFEGIEFIHQEPQNGTGHAVQQLMPALHDFKGELLVLNGDVPLLKANTIEKLISKHRSVKPSVSLLSATLENPNGYGRVFSDTKGNVEKIIEDRDCTKTQLTNKLTNAGVYCFDWQQLSSILPSLSNENDQKEIYLTDAIQQLSSAIHLKVDNPDEVCGINDKLQLSECEELIQKQLRNFWMKKGVKFINPSSCTLSEKCKLGQDIIIEPQTHIRGESQIGDNCILGPNSFIENSNIGSDVDIFYSVVKDSEIGNEVKIGPYAHIRPETTIFDKCKIGNFVEIKKSNLKENTKVNHLTYLGDSDIGNNVNIGAGTITANFDGKRKHKTIIGSYSNTGANSVLIAPVTIGQNVTVGAGSTITKNVPSDSLALGRSKQLIKSNWNKKTKKD